MSGREEIRAGILDLMAGGFEAETDPGLFEALALGAFEYQFRSNVPYRRYCERRNARPGTVGGWRDIPAVPTAAFKAGALVCGSPDDVEAVFRTSGTTGGPERRGLHYVRDLGLYRASARINFRAHVLPDGVSLPMQILGPPPKLAPESSLTWMCELVRREFAASGSDYWVDGDGLRADALISTLRAYQDDGEPVALLGTAIAIAHLLETLEDRGLRLRLAAGSRVMETGGFKRRRGEIPRREFYERLAELLGLSPVYCVAEYGMTELCSQFYDNVLRARARGHAPTHRFKVVPPWVRTLVVDPETLEPVPEGTVGVLRHCDLANLDSVLAVQTDDLGVAGAGGFEILGRAAGAEARGCSIAMDEWLTAQR